MKFNQNINNTSMVYNIFCSHFQKNDNMLSNLIRRVKFYDNVAKTCNKYEIYGATILKTIGLYEGAKESSFLLQIIGSYDISTIKAFCQELRAINNQDSILLQLVDANILIYKDKEENI